MPGRSYLYVLGIADARIRNYRDRANQAFAAAIFCLCLLGASFFWMATGGTLGALFFLGSGAGFLMALILSRYYERRAEKLER